MPAGGAHLRLVLQTRLWPPRPAHEACPPHRVTTLAPGAGAVRALAAGSGRGGGHCPGAPLRPECREPGPRAGPLGRWRPCCGRCPAHGVPADADADADAGVSAKDAAQGAPDCAAQTVWLQAGGHSGGPGQRPPSGQSRVPALERATAASGRPHTENTHTTGTSRVFKEENHELRTQKENRRNRGPSGVPHGGQPGLGPRPRDGGGAPGWGLDPASPTRSPQSRCHGGRGAVTRTRCQQTGCGPHGCPVHGGPRGGLGGASFVPAAAPSFPLCTR